MSLQSNKSPLSQTEKQIQYLEKPSGRSTFKTKLITNELFPLKPSSIEIFQMNLGKMCNQVCEHCHVDAGPDRKEIMTKEVMISCLEAIKKLNIHTVDLTGGAPEMNPHFEWLITELALLDLTIIVRSNLTILTSNKKYREFPALFKRHKVQVVSSLPCYTEDNVDKQRGNGVFNKSIEALQILNEIGYGQINSDLQINLVYNPGGAHLPPDQAKLEIDYKKHLLENFNIKFNKLFTITNLPISRYLDYLIQSEKYDDYMDLLIESFNPIAVNNLMCKNTISISWDGFLYDCDFNQMLDLKINCSNSTHINDFNEEALLKREIILGQHCFGCTAGSGSSCQGSLV